MAVVVINQAALRDFTGWGGPVGRATARAVRDATWRSKRLVPHEYSQAGRLSGSIDNNLPQRRRNAMGIWANIGSKLPYALFIESGTRPHPITPKNGPFLVFYWRRTGRVEFMKAVFHPGNRAYRYLERGLLTAVARTFGTGAGLRR